MAHDVFISYSSRDKPTADAVVAMLESQGIRCWVAPRDILPGVEYAEALVEALHESRLMVLVFSADSNRSQHVLREVERAVSQGIPILPLRIENVPPSRAMEYYISSRHWLDAMTPPLERHLEQLAGTAKLLLSRPSGGPAAPAQSASASLSAPRPDAPLEAGSSFTSRDGFPLRHAMANGGVLPRDGHGAISDALHSIAAAVQHLDAWRLASGWIRAAFRQRPRTAFAILAAALLVLGGASLLWMHNSNPIYRAERALENGRAEAVLRVLEGVKDNPRAAFLRGRALYSLKRPEEGIAQYKDAAARDPAILSRGQVLQDLEQNLGGRQSQDAVDLLVQAGDPAVDLLAEAARDTQNAKRRWAAIDALRRLKREDRVDLISIHLQDLKSKDCAVSSKAAKSLGELGDKRAIPALREVAQRKTLMFDACEAPAARAALRKLQKK